jgi:hypothetical protein
MSTEKNQKTTSQLKLSSSDEFRMRREELVEGKLIQLPDSGLVIRCARPELEGMILNDKLPKDLIATAIKRQGGDLNENDIKRVIEMRDYIVSQAVKEPKVVDKDPKEGEITIDWLSRADKDFIFNYVEKGESVLKIFRQK